MAAPEPLAGISSPAVFPPGSTVGRFRIGDQLGRGGMGEVYRAEDTKLKRVVALKRLSTELRADQCYRRRFQEEAERVSRFCDAHVAALYDVLEERGEIFLVMEYVEGQNLRKRLQAPLSLDQFFDIAIQCTEALAAAHDVGLVHCDVKPENVMLNTHGQVKILDFGLARHLPRSDQSSTMESAALAGTPAYMSPEVLLQELPDGRSDVFSLGVMFYEMLTGHHPFSSRSFLVTADRIRKETPAPIHIFNPAVPRALEKLILRAMAKDRNQRHESARALLDDLQQIRSGRKSEAPRVPGAWRRPVFWAPVAAAVLLFVAALWIYQRPTSRPILAPRGWVLISDFEGSDAAFPGAGFREGLTVALQQSRYVNVFPRTRIYEALQRMKRADVGRIDENIGREICQRENLQILIVGRLEQVGSTFQITVRGVDPKSGADLFGEQERFDNRDQLLDRADTLARRVRRDLGESLSGIETSSQPLAKVTTSSLEALELYSQAVDAMAQGNLDRMPMLLGEAVKLDPNFAMAHLLLGNYYSWLVGKNRRALAEFQRAYELREAVSDREQRRIEAFYYSALERYEEAAQALGLLVSLYPDDTEAHEELATAYFNLGQVQSAISELRRVLQLTPSSSLAYRNLVLYLARIGAYDEAMAAFHAAEQQKAVTPELHWGLGLAYLGQGKIPEARAEFAALGGGTGADRDLRDLYLTVTDLYQARLGRAQADLKRQLDAAGSSPAGLHLVRRMLLGRIYLSQSKRKQAELQGDLILRTPDSDLQTNDLLQAGILYARSGETGKAGVVLRRLQAVSQAPPTSWETCSYRNLEGELLLAQVRISEAEAAFNAALRASPQVDSHLGLAKVYQAQHRWALAAEQWQSVLAATGEIVQNEFPPDLLLARLQLARASVQMQQPDQAAHYYRELLEMSAAGDQDWIPRAAKRELQPLIINH